MKCPRKSCGYEWKSRVKNPKACPKCKQYIKSPPPHPSSDN